MRNVTTTTPLEYIYEFTQNSTHSALSFSLGKMNYNSSITQLFPFCWCRDVFIDRVWREVPALDPTTTYVLLVRDISFKTHFTKVAQGAILEGLSHSWLDTKNMPVFFEYAEPWGITAVHIPKGWINFPYILSYFALLLRVISLNHSNHPFNVFFDAVKKAGLNDPIMFNMFAPYKKYSKMFDARFYENLNFGNWANTPFPKYGPHSLLKMVASCDVPNNQNIDDRSMKYIVQEVLPLLKSIKDEEIKNGNSKTKK